MNPFSLSMIFFILSFTVLSYLSASSAFMNELMFSGTSKMGRWAFDGYVDIFSKKMLLFPYSLNEHRSLFVVVNASTELNGHGVNSVSDERPLLVHFDSSPTGSTHETELVSCKISAWLNGVWHACCRGKKIKLRTLSVYLDPDR